MTTEAAKSKALGRLAYTAQRQRPHRRAGATFSSCRRKERFGSFAPAALCVLRRYLKAAFCMSRLSTECCTPSTCSPAHQNGNFRRQVRFIPRLRFPKIESCSDAMTAKCMHWIGSTGSKLWEAPTGAEVWAVSCGSRWSCLFRKCDARVYAVDAATGRTLWVQELGGRIYSTIYAAEHQLYLGCGDGKVYSLDPSSGKTLWSTPTGNGIDSSPAVRR